VLNRVGRWGRGRERGEEEEEGDIEWMRRKLAREKWEAGQVKKKGCERGGSGASSRARSWTEADGRLGAIALS
jgi:hypothetical protein